MLKKVGVCLVLAVFTMSLTTFAEVVNPDWWKKAAEPYQGVTIRGVSESTPASKAVADIAAKEFEEVTGIKVEFEPTSWDQMYTKAINDIQAGSGIYDFIYLEQDIVYTYLAQDWLINQTKLMADNAALVYPDFDIDDFTTFIDYFKDANGDLYGMPFEAFLKTYVYRKDLFEDADVQAAFKEKYGWDLKPPTDWNQYAQIAEFFTEWGKDKEIYGHTAQAKTHPCIAYEVEESIWPTWGVWNWGINMENWKATSANGGTMDSELAKEALKMYVDLLQYAPPGVKTYTWDETAAAIASGKVAQGLIYGENTAWIATDADRSKVTGKIGVALPPTYEGVMEKIEAGEGYIGYYDGGAFGIPVSSKNPEAAMLFLQFVSRKEWAPEFAALAARVVRKSTFDSDLIKEMDPKVDGYYTMLKEFGQLFAGAPAFPMHPVLNEIQMKWIVKAVAGEASAAEACDAMAKEIDETLADLGY
ncbi:sugar ABC transporter substrate-binding protein [candidate division KSB3 bacterium]|uniref:Sugar ABC transporter substrate-binding protein n=1 Tax=candidate division KSB3 bacterium TaxID=2044937 RepID=A0A2G6K943_9BACT|nr:MAG: sugar ABC transporter substrate-binding protein [candidate division KSB3 bacterium]